MNAWLLWAISLAAILALNLLIISVLEHIDRRRQLREARQTPHGATGAAPLPAVPGTADEGLAAWEAEANEGRGWLR